MKKVLKSVVSTIVAIFIMVSILLCLPSCSQAERASYNLSKQADYFNCVRQITVINCVQGDVLLQITGKMSIQSAVGSDELVVIVEDYDGAYKKIMVGISDNVTYIVEDLKPNYVSSYRYTINFNPDMWIPVNVESFD